MPSTSPASCLPSSALDHRPIQSQPLSPLLTLPPEIRNQIYNHLFPQGTSITDPAFVEQKSLYCSIPDLNIALFSTCRQIYAEADLRPLFSTNVFHFTRATIAQDFLRQLPVFHRNLITDIEVDVRDVNDQSPAIARTWIQYLFWRDSKWSDSFGSLNYDASGLKTLRLNFSAWKIINTKRQALWDLLISLMKSVRGLDSFILVGSGIGRWMQKQDPWSPVHYVGSDSVGSDAVLDKMISAVGPETDYDNKLITWTRSKAKIYLTVAMTQKAPLDRSLQDECCGTPDAIGVLPPSGWCTVEAYYERTEAMRRLTLR